MSDKSISKFNKEEILARITDWFSDSVSWDKKWRDNSKIWYEYYHGIQWSAEEVSALRDRGQAVSTYNFIKPAIDSIIGSERQNRPKVSMAGRELSDDKLAETKTRLYDYIQYNTNTDDELDSTIRDTFVTGRGWLYIYPEERNGVMDVYHSYIDYRDMFVDQLSKRDDMQDSRYLHYAVFVDEDTIKAKFSNYNANGSISSMFNAEGSSDDDLWVQTANRKRVRLINTWYRDEEGIVHTVVWVKGQILFEDTNPYECDKFPFVQMTINRDLENMPYGFTKTMMSPQEEVNKRHSKALHYLNAKQVLAEEDAFVDWSEAKKMLAKPDGIVKLNDGALADGKVQIIDNTPLASAHLELMNVAKSNILLLAGLNPAYVGQAGQYESAKKANLSISQAQNSIVPILNKIRIARYDLAYITMKLVPKFYTDTRMLRIIEPNGSYAFMPVNEVKTLDDGTYARINDITSDDVDIVIEDAPRGLNEREEQFNQLLTIQGQTSQPIPMEILLRYSSIKDKHQLANDIEGSRQIQQQLEQVKQYAQQLEGQVKQLGGQVQQQQSQIVQTQTARAVDKEVHKAKEKMTQNLMSL